MKKIIAILVAAMLLVTSLLVAVPASAAAVKTYKVDWSALEYNTYVGSGGVGSSYDAYRYESMFTVTKTETSISSDGTSANENMAYVATATFAITADTEYEYEFKAKNDNATLYAGVPYAIEGGTVYMIYGSFNNTSDDYNGSKSELRFSRGSFDWEYPSVDNRAFPALTLDSQGYSTIKVVYKGYDVEIYGLVGSEYKKQGETITLPEGSAVAMGVYSREKNDDNLGRTVSVKDAVVYGMNQAAAANMVINASNGAGELKTEIVKVEKEYLEVDYTEDSFAAYKEALDNAKAVADDVASTAADVTDALTTLQTAVDGLELAEVDTAKLEEAIAKAEALKEVEYTPITFGMVKKAVETGKALLENAEAKQSQINAATDDIEGRIEALQPSGAVAEPDDDEGEADGDATEAPATDAPAGDAGTQPITPAPAPANKGCGSAVATTAVVLGLVATLGTALVIKKRD